MGGFEPIARDQNDQPSLWSIWGSLSRMYKWGNLQHLISYWLNPELQSVGMLDPQQRTLTWHMGIKGRRFHLPPHLCLTCCSLGTGRLRVLLGRSPFARLISLFRLNWLGKPDKL